MVQPHPAGRRIGFSCLFGLFGFLVERSPPDEPNKPNEQNEPAGGCSRFSSSLTISSA
jgi:hypothetical protein